MVASQGRAKRDRRSRKKNRANGHSELKPGAKADEPGSSRHDLIHLCIGWEA